MRIVISSTGRFHVADLGRELQALGHDVVFLSSLPPGRLKAVGFAPRRHLSFFPLVGPLAALNQKTQGAFQEQTGILSCRLHDYLAARFMPRCDVFIGMAGMALTAGLAARRKYGAKFIVERGSLHAAVQKRILEEIPGWPAGKAGMPRFFLERNLAEYEAADAIAVPSRQAVESFLQQGVPEARLFLNPYGTDLAMFPPTVPAPGRPPTILTVGAWSRQKGSDILLEAWRRLGGGIRLLHVGSAGDCPFPEDPGFRHVEPVPQWTLKDWYAQGDVFVLASRQDGFGLVLSQALACGLPVVCTARTGGADLAEMMPDKTWVTVVPAADAGALAAGLRGALDKAAAAGPGLRDALGSAREKLGWKGYGARYSAFLEKLAGGKGGGA